MVFMSFSVWAKEREAAHEMEWAIIKDKLALGVGGVEWLAMEIKPEKARQDALTRWNDLHYELGTKNLVVMMADCLLMDSESFYDRHEFNWWIAVKNTLTYLSLLRQRDYSGYSEFIQKLERKGAM